MPNSPMIGAPYGTDGSSAGRSTARPLIATRAGWAVIVVLAMGGAALVWNWRRSGAETRGVAAPSSGAVRAVVQLPPGTTLAIGRGSAVALSADGRTIAYTAQSGGSVHLYLHPLDRFESAALAGTDGATDPFFSPDGRWLGFFAGDHLKKIPIERGAAVTLADATAPRGSAWDGDAVLLTPRNNTALWRVPTTGGRPEPATTLAAGEMSHRWPQILPRGAGVLFTIWNDNGWEPAQIAAQPRDGREHRVILTGGGFGRFIGTADDENGFLVYTRHEQLFAVPFNLSTLEMAGRPVVVVDGVVTNLSGGAQFAVSASGSLAYVSGSGGEGERSLVWVDRNGRQSASIALRGMRPLFDLSPDGARVARYNAEGPTRDVWIEELASGASTQITFDGEPVSTAVQVPSDRLNAVWSPDGDSIVYAAGFPASNLFRVPATGGATPERLTTGASNQMPVSWSPDGRALAFVELDPLSGADIRLLMFDDSMRPVGVRPFLSTPFSESMPVISPDGRWLAYISNESGRFEVYIQPFPAGGPRGQISTDGGVYPRWSRTGRELFFRSGPTRADMMAAAVTGTANLQIDPPRRLFDASEYDAFFAVSADDQRFLVMPRLEANAVTTQINVVVDWLAELRRRR